MEQTMILIQLLPIEQGTSERGKAWKRTTAVFETVEKFSKKVAVTFLDNLADVIHKYKPGHLLKVKMDAESHDYNGRWYTELRAWQVRPAYEVPPIDVQTGQPTHGTAAAAPNAATQPQATTTDANPDPIPDFDTPLPPL